MSQTHFELESEDRKRFPIPDLPCTLGRSRDSDLGIDLDRISRRHARLESHPDGLLVTDLNSTNGTFIRHERIEQPTLLREGDSIHLADHAFVLRRRSNPPSELTLADEPASSDRSPDTVIGFTALPTGFPVQAPEFYELLNDEQIAATAQAIHTASGQLFGHSLNGRSSHPKLAADPKLLFRLAEQLGEETRLAELIRRISLKQADQAGLQTSLFLKIHPVECEQIEPLLEQLEAQARQYRHLDLVFDLPLAVIDDLAALQKLHERLTELGSALCGRADEPIDSTRLARQVSFLAFLRLPATAGPERVGKVGGILPKRCQIMIDGVDQADHVANLAAAGASLFLGQAIARREDL